MSRPQAYVFDLDGTLATIPVNWAKVKEGLREISGSEEELKSVFPSIVELVERKPGLRKQMFAAIDRYELEGVPMARLYEGSRELLSRVSETSKVSLVTMQGEKACSLLLERFDLNQYFIHCFTREDSLDRAEQVRLALASMHVTKDAGMFVGDRFNDLNAAKKLGVPFTLIRTHGDDPEEDDVRLYHSVTEFLSSLET